jgi:hypothetical protein
MLCGHALRVGWYWASGSPACTPPACTPASALPAARGQPRAAPRRPSPLPALTHGVLCCTGAASGPAARPPSPPVARGSPTLSRTTRPVWLSTHPTEQRPLPRPPIPLSRAARDVLSSSRRCWWGRSGLLLTQLTRAACLTACPAKTQPHFGLHLPCHPMDLRRARFARRALGWRVWRTQPCAIHMRRKRCRRKKVRKWAWNATAHQPQTGRARTQCSNQGHSQTLKIEHKLGHPASPGAGSGGRLQRAKCVLEG